MFLLCHDVPPLTSQWDTFMLLKGTCPPGPLLLLLLLLRRQQPWLHFQREVTLMTKILDFTKIEQHNSSDGFSLGSGCVALRHKRWLWMELWLVLLCIKGNQSRLPLPKVNHWSACMFVALVPSQLGHWTIQPKKQTKKSTLSVFEDFEHCRLCQCFYYCMF